MQVSKGLKRATGRDEQVQHHLGTLDFCYPLEFLVASSPKVSRLDASRLPWLASREKSHGPRGWTLPKIRITIV
jgi:hypothetical protein